MTQVRGIHHVSTIASDPQRNLDFFAGLLGLRLVKRTVNFDDPETYHLYYGDAVGTPGCIMTFFPWPGAKPGRQGPGECAVVSFSVLPAAIGFWLERFVRHGVTHELPVSRGSGDDAERVLAFRDHDGALYELVGHRGGRVAARVDGGARHCRRACDPRLSFRHAVGRGGRADGARARRHARLPRDERARDDEALRGRRGRTGTHRGRALGRRLHARREGRGDRAPRRVRRDGRSGPSSRCASR